MRILAPKGVAYRLINKAGENNKDKKHQVISSCLSKHSGNRVTWYLV